MKVFIGLLICMGLVRLPNLQHYWARSDLYGVNCIRQNMARDRFLLLRKFWHFADNEEPSAQQGRLYHIQHLMEKMNRNLYSVLEPGKQIVIDETMIPWRGRLAFRQYIPGKTHKYGVNL